MITYPHNANELPTGIKQAARLITKHAIANGLIQMDETCALCNKPGLLEAHHINYYKPLAIVWLCKSCHAQQHPEIASFINPRPGLFRPSQYVKVFGEDES